MNRIARARSLPKTRASACGGGRVNGTIHRGGVDGFAIAGGVEAANIERTGVTFDGGIAWVAGEWSTRCHRADCRLLHISGTLFEVCPFTLDCQTAEDRFSWF